MEASSNNKTALNELQQRQKALQDKRAALQARMAAFQNKSLLHMESWLGIQSHVEQISKWEEVQTFMMAQWINHHLARVSQNPIENLHELRDGNVLCALMEALSEKEIKSRRFQTCKFKVHRINNLNLAFTRMKEEGVKLVNVGPEDIEGCQKKSLMGLIWQLIEFYQLNIRWKKPNAKEGQGNSLQNVSDVGGAGIAEDGKVEGEEDDEDEDAEDELHEWAARCCMPYGLESSWDLGGWIADGRVFGAIAAFLDPEFDYNHEIKENAPYENMTKTFAHCKEKLNIPQLVRVSEESRSMTRVDIPGKVVTTQFAVMRQRFEQPEKFEKINLAPSVAAPAEEVEEGQVKREESPELRVEEEEILDEAQLIDEANQQVSCFFSYPTVNDFAFIL